MGGPACQFRPCDCAGEEEERPFNCRDMCCCECNYKAPAWMPTATPSSAQVATPPTEFMQEMSRLSHSGFTLQLVGPGGSVRTLDNPFGAHSSHSGVTSGRSTPVLSLHGSPVTSAREVGSSRRISLQVPERINRAQYDRAHHSDTRLFTNNARRTSSDAGSHSRVLPRIPDFATEQHSVT